MGPDYHVLYQRHTYSVPHALVGSYIDIEAGPQLVRLYHRGQMVAQHTKALNEGGFTTLDEHMPDSHRYQRWGPERLLSWGASIASATRTVVAWRLNLRKHPEQAFRSCLGLLSLVRKYGDARLETACQQVIVNMLANRREGEPTQAAEAEDDVAEHGNVRGGGYYH